MPKLQQRIAALEERMAAPGFWDDGGQAQRTVAEVSGLKRRLHPFLKLEQRAADLDTLVELAREADDADTAREAVAEYGALTKPGVCGDEPLKSKTISSPVTRTVSAMRIVEPSRTPS